MKKVWMVTAVSLMLGVSVPSRAASPSALATTVAGFRSQLGALELLGRGSIPLGVGLLKSTLSLPKGTLPGLIGTGPAVVTSLVATGTGSLGALPGLSVLKKIAVHQGDVSGINALPDGIIVSGVLKSLPLTGPADVVNVLTIVKQVNLKK